MCIVFLPNSRIFRFITFVHFVHRQVIVPFFILSAGNRCYHITSAASCKQLAACLFCGKPLKIWYQHLIIFWFITFLHFVHRQVIVPLCILSAGNRYYHITSASHNTSASNRCSTSQSVLFSFFISSYCRPFAGAQYLTIDVSSSMCKTSIPAACWEGSILSSSLSCRFRSANDHYYS